MRRSVFCFQDPVNSRSRSSCEVAHTHTQCLVLTKSLTPLPQITLQDVRCKLRKLIVRALLFSFLLLLLLLPAAITAAAASVSATVAATVPAVITANAAATAATNATAQLAD